MVRSMTGYGSAEARGEAGLVRVEARSVNARHLRVSFQGPSGLDAWEADLRAAVERRVRRGHITLRIEGEAPEEGGAAWELDEGRVRGLLEAFETLRQRFNLPGQPDLGLLVRSGGILREARRDAPPWLEETTVQEAVEGAVDALVEMREAEGRRLQKDLGERLQAIRSGLDAVERLAPERLERERRRLLEAVGALVADRQVDEARVEQEVALLADRWDLGEELVRARAHVEAFAEYLEAASEEPVGKRLSFLIQELHRELNTTGAKANDAAISRRVVEMKNEVERLREQVENVE